MQAAHKSKTMATRLLPLAIVLLGFALRLYQLEGQSMWSDEGLSLYRAGLSLPEIFDNVITVDGVHTQDTNPPLYFLVLHLFKALAGDTIFSLRFIGVAIATLVLPLMYVLGASSFDRRVGLVASFLMAISPFHIWQSQVMRNYGILLTFNLLSVYGLLRFALAKEGDRRARWLMLWLGAGLVGIYTHYFGFFIFGYGLIALAIIVVGQWDLGRLVRRWQFWLMIGLGILIITPAVIVGSERFMAGQQVDFYQVPLLKVLNQAASAFSVGVNWTLMHPWWRTMPLVLLALFGLYFGWRKRPGAAALLLGYQVLPLAMLLTVSLMNPLYNGVRHLLIALPPFLIFLAGGIIGPLQLPVGEGNNNHFRNFWKVVGPILAVIIVISQLAWLNEQFTSPDLIRDDIRGVAAYLNDHAAENDVVVIHDTLIKFTFDYYYQGDAPVVAVPDFSEVDSESAIRTLQQVAEGRDRVWFLARPTPRTAFDSEVIPDWLNENWLPVYGENYPAMWLQVRLEGYDLPAIVQGIPESTRPADVSWPEKLRLHGYEFPQEVTSGDKWLMDFYLSQPTEQAEQHTLSLRLVDSQGQVWSQIDESILQGYPPVSTVPDALFHYIHRVGVPAGLPPGDYQLWLRLVRTADGTAIPMAGGDLDLFLGDVTMEPASCGAADRSQSIEVRQTARFGPEMEFIGHSRPVDVVRPGHTLSLDLLWCAREQPAMDYRWQLQLKDGSGQVAAQATGPLSAASYPPSRWQPDELVMGRASLVVPATVEEGAYELALSILPPDSDRARPINGPLGKKQLLLGSIDLLPWPMETELPPVSVPFEAKFGQPAVIELHGYDLTDSRVFPGQTLDLTLLWRSLGEEIPVSYTVFVHLLDGEGTFWAQGDAIPVAGFRPTTSWRTGEVIVDTHQIMIPPEADAGEYTLWIGFYDASTGLRLPITRDNLPVPDDRLLLQTIQIGD